MDLFNILIATAALINLSLGVLVYVKHKNPSAVWFSVLAFALAVWCGAILGGRMVQSAKPAMILAKLIYASGLFIPALFFYFAHRFPSRDDKPRTWIKFLAFVPTGLFIWVILFTNAVVTDVVIESEGEKMVRFGLGYPLYFLVMVGYFLAAFSLLMRSYVSAKEMTRVQVRYVLLGTGLATLIALTTNLVLPSFGSFTLGWTIGPLSTVLMALFITYAILKHHLLNIKVISIEILAGLMVLVSLVNVILSQSLNEFLLRIPLFVLLTSLAAWLLHGVFLELEQAQNLQRANAKLRQLDELKTLFLSIASHQLRTPLTAIKGYVSMIIKGDFGQAPAPIQDTLEGVYANANRLIRLVNTFLNLSRIESDRLTIHKQAHDVIPIVKNILAELRLTAEEKDVKLSFSSPRSSLAARVDRDKIEDVLINLIDNALKYTPKGGAVAVKLADLGDRVRVEVKDTGQGLSPSEMKSLFQKFARGKTASRVNTSGSGLGLYIAKRIVELHHGHIGVESLGIGKGSTFWVEVPKG